MEVFENCQTELEITDLLDQLAYLRRNAPEQIFNIHNKLTQQLIRALKDTEIRLQNEDCAIPHPDYLDNDFRRGIIDNPELILRSSIKQVYEKIKLINIIKKKKNCTISKIIDAI